MDLHHNLFYSYRGQSTNDPDHDPQLENNLTKALINTLKLGGETVWSPFLAELGIAGVPRNFLLQRCDLPGRAATKRHRLLLGISKEESSWSPDASLEPMKESRPDAWVFGDEFAILIESKVNCEFSPEQMQAHLTYLRSLDGIPPRIKLLTWKQIHRLFANFFPNLTEPGPRLLVEQFIQFLEYSGMSGFTGFRREHFDYFVLHDDDDARRWILEQVNDFATQVQAKLLNFAPFYEAYNIGTLKRTDSSCWFAFGPRNTYRNVTHQSLSLEANGLKVFVNAELKTATDRVKTVVRRGGDLLLDVLQNLHLFESFDLTLNERKQRQASLYKSIPKMRLNSSMFDAPNTREVAWTAFSQTVQQLDLFQVSIERYIPPSKLLELSQCDPPEALGYIVEILKRNHAVVQLLND